MEFNVNADQFGVILALVSFAISSVFYLIASSSDRMSTVVYRISYGSFIFAMFLVTFASIQSLVEPLAPSSSGVYLVAALCWITFIAQIVFKISTLGTYIAPLATLILMLQMLTTPQGAGITGPDSSTLLKVHIYASIIGEAFAILAFVTAILYLAQKRALKKKQLGKLLANTLSLDSLDRLLLLSIWIGFILLTIGLILGAIYTQTFTQNEVTDTSKIIWAIAVWLWYLATLLTRNIFSFPAKRVAQMTFVGFGIMAIGFFGLYV
jgi:ABC-type uncharacterized transport system permease subunit